MLRWLNERRLDESNKTMAVDKMFEGLLSKLTQIFRGWGPWAIFEMPTVV